MAALLATLAGPSSWLTSQERMNRLAEVVGVTLGVALVVSWCRRAWRKASAG
jgi:hypothetical protein